MAEKKKANLLIAIILFIVLCSYPLGILFRSEPNEEISQCGIWALGDDWASVETRDIPARWNERHGDLFELHIDDDLREGNKRIYDAWKTRKEESDD